MFENGQLKKVETQEIIPEKTNVELVNNFLNNGSNLAEKLKEALQNDEISLSDLSLVVTKLNEAGLNLDNTEETWNVVENVVNGNYKKDSLKDAFAKTLHNPDDVELRNDYEELKSMYPEIDIQAVEDGIKAQHEKILEEVRKEQEIVNIQKKKLKDAFKATLSDPENQQAKIDYEKLKVEHPNVSSDEVESEVFKDIVDIYQEIHNAKKSLLKKAYERTIMEPDNPKAIASYQELTERYNDIPKEDIETEIMTELSNPEAGISEVEQRMQNDRDNYKERLTLNNLRHAYRRYLENPDNEELKGRYEQLKSENPDISIDEIERYERIQADAEVAEKSKTREDLRHAYRRYLENPDNEELKGRYEQLKSENPDISIDEIEHQNT